jgi:hypothetical protein
MSADWEAESSSRSIKSLLQISLSVCGVVVFRKLIRSWNGIKSIFTSQKYYVNQTRYVAVLNTDYRRTSSHVRVESRSDVTTATTTTEALHWLDDPFTAQEEKHIITAVVRQDGNQHT